MQIKLCKLHNAKQIIRDKLRKYIKKTSTFADYRVKIVGKGLLHTFSDKLLNCLKTAFPYLMPHSILILKCRV